MLGISADSPFANIFAEKNGINFDLLSDIPCGVRKTYDVVFENFGGIDGYAASQRAVFVVNRDGVLTYSEVCANPGLQPDYDAPRRRSPEPKARRKLSRHAAPSIGAFEQPRLGAKDRRGVRGVFRSSDNPAPKWTVFYPHSW